MGPRRSFLSCLSCISVLVVQVVRRNILDAHLVYYVKLALTAGDHLPGGDDHENP